MLVSIPAFAPKPCKVGTQSNSSISKAYVVLNIGKLLAGVDPPPDGGEYTKVLSKYQKGLDKYSGKSKVEPSVTPFLADTSTAGAAIYSAKSSVAICKYVGNPDVYIGASVIPS